MAARLVAAAHANDISGSIRIPSAHCGLVGLKPSRGRTVASIAGDARTGMNAEGVVTRSVRDTAGLVDAISVAGSRSLLPCRRPAIPTLRVGLWTQAFNGSSVDPENAAAAEHCASLLEGLGSSVEISSPTQLSDPALWKAAATLLAVNIAVEVDTWSAKIGRELGEGDLEATTWRMVTTGRGVTAVELLAAQSLLIEHTGKPRSGGTASTSWSRRPRRTPRHRWAITPRDTSRAAAAPSLDRSTSPVSRRSAFRSVGRPTVCLAGFRLIAPMGHDDVLITVAAALESVEPWQQRRATVSA